jgi:serine/threonine protein kinase
VRVKLIDLGAASFIPPRHMPAPATAGDAYGSDEDAAADATAVEKDALSRAAAAHMRGMAALLDQKPQGATKGGLRDLSNALASPLSASALWLKRRAQDGGSQGMPATSLNYRPPELDVLDPWWGAGVDLWAVGCVVTECYAGLADFAARYAAATSLEPSLSGDPPAAQPALEELGRAPLFRAASAFEHLAMVERCVGHLPDRLYALWPNVEAPPFVSEEARRRVEGTAPSLRAALETNREALKRDRSSRHAIHRSRLAQAEANAQAEPSAPANFSAAFARGAKDDTNGAARAARRALAAVAAEEAAVAVEEWRADAVHSLVAALLHPDANQRPTAAEARAHKALQPKGSFLAMLY